MFYSVVLVSAIQQSESRSWTSLPSHPSRSPQSTKLSSLCGTVVNQTFVYFEWLRKWLCMLLDLNSITVKITYDKLMPCQTLKNGSLIHLLWGIYVRKHLLKWADIDQLPLLIKHRYVWFLCVCLWFFVDLLWIIQSLNFHLMFLIIWATL